MKKSIAGILKEEGYIEDFEVIDDNKQGMIKVTTVSYTHLDVYKRQTEKLMKSDSRSQLLTLKKARSWT